MSKDSSIPKIIFKIWKTDLHCIQKPKLIKSNLKSRDSNFGHKDKTSCITMDLAKMTDMQMVAFSMLKMKAMFSVLDRELS